MNRVWIAQCLCPQRHCIMAGADEAKSGAEAEQKVMRYLRETVEEWLARGTINPWCGLCGAPQESWTFELGRTRWATLEEALPEMRKSEAEQAATSAVWGDIHRSKPDA
jgi:hypothetical protein